MIDEKQNTGAPQDKRVELTALHKELLKCPTIASQLPVVFNNGNELECFEGSCSGCGKRFSERDLTGRVNTGFKGVVVIDAVGVCQPCNLLTPFKMRVKENFTYETINERGEWARGRFEPVRFIDRIIERVKVFFLGEDYSHGR